MRLTFWSCLIRCANMKWIWGVLLKIQSGHDSVHRQTDGQTDKVKSIEAEGIITQMICYIRADSMLAPSQWETPLESNDISHWLGANLESALLYNHVVLKADWFSFRADSGFASSQRETALLCNDVSHWLGANLESAQSFIPERQELA